MSVSFSKPGLFEPRRIGEMSPATKILLYSVLIGWSLFVIFPIYWLVITSFKTPATVNEGPFFIPFVDFQPSLHAWADLFIYDAADTFRAYFNSIVIAFSATALSVFVGSMAAYSLSRIEFAPNLITILYFVVLLVGAGVAIGVYGSDLWLTLAICVALFFLLARAVGRLYTVRLGNGDILFWIISQRILAPIVVVVPIYMMFQSVRMLDTHIAIIITYAVVNLPIVVWLMFDFFNSIPRDLEESAQLDGATMIMTFREIVLPLSRTGLAATTLLVMIFSWNEYLFALFISTSKAQTLPILVAAMNAGERGILWWTMSVAIIIMIIPVVALAVVLQKYISKGLLVGAVKG
ncbi:MAG: carbohydrate ABC transporter permease [Litoreibacter sp.]|nr:carbohydrate ABC transporter permease [Litoreibacter sp.]